MIILVKAGGKRCDSNSIPPPCSCGCSLHELGETAFQIGISNPELCCCGCWPTMADYTGQWAANQLPI